MGELCDAGERPRRGLSSCDCLGSSVTAPQRMLISRPDLWRIINGLEAMLGMLRELGERSEPVRVSGE